MKNYYFQLLNTIFSFLPSLLSLPTHSLFFRPGDMITLLEDSNEDWWKVSVSLSLRKKIIWLL